MMACFFCVTSWMTTATSRASTPIPIQAHVDMRASIPRWRRSMARWRAGRAGAPSLAGPEPDRSGIHVDELAGRVQPDAAELLILRPRVELQRGDLREVEVDRVALGMIAVPRDLVALLAQ